MTEETACTKKQQKRIVMWGTPRSLSTAMLRAFLNRKSCRGMFEPFSRAYFFGTERTHNWFGVGPLENFTYLDMKKMFYDGEFDTDEVFIKDFPVYIYSQKAVDPKELMPQNYTHTFLIRSPQECVESSYRLFLSKKVRNWTEWEPEFINFKYLWDHYNEVIKFQPDALIFHADDLMKYPEATLRLFCERTGIEFQESMLTWKETDGFAQKLKATFPFVLPFFETVISATGINVGTEAKQAEKAKQTVVLPPEIQKEVDESNVYYEKLLKLATRVTAP